MGNACWKQTTDNMKLIAALSLFSTAVNADACTDKTMACALADAPSTVAQQAFIALGTGGTAAGVACFMALLPCVLLMMHAKQRSGLGLSWRLLASATGPTSLRPCLPRVPPRRPFALLPLALLPPPQPPKRLWRLRVPVS